MTSLLVRIDAVRRALSAAKSIVEVKEIRDTAEGWRAYAQQAKDRGLQVDAAELSILATRRLGELILAQRATYGLSTGSRGQLAGRDVSGGTKTVPPENPPTLAAVGVDKKLSVRAQQIARYSDAQFTDYLAEWRARVLQETERVTSNLVRAGRRPPKPRDVPALPHGVYRLIYADPPWPYEHVATDSRAIENQYPTMTLDEICAVDVPAAADAVLFLWAPPPKLADAIRVIEAWAFDYRTAAVWDKEIVGMGYYFRQQFELLLVAARGALPVPLPSLRPASVVRARRTGHSVKPECFHELLERMYPHFGDLDRLEMFSRSHRPGWTHWGHEVPA